MHGYNNAIIRSKSTLKQDYYPGQMYIFSKNVDTILEFSNIEEQQVNAKFQNFLRPYSEILYDRYEKCQILHAEDGPILHISTWTVWLILYLFISIGYILSSFEELKPDLYFHKRT